MAGNENNVLSWCNVYYHCELSIREKEERENDNQVYEFGYIWAVDFQGY